MQRKFAETQTVQRGQARDVLKENLYRCHASVGRAIIIRAVPVPSYGPMIDAACPHVPYLGILNYSYLGQKRTFSNFSQFLFFLAIILNIQEYIFI